MSEKINFDAILNHEGSDHTERAFRRGYHQATATILAALEGGCTLHDLGVFHDKVQDWRETRGFVGFQPPPAIRKEVDR